MINLADKGGITDYDGTVVGDCRFTDANIIKVIDRLGINVTINTMDGRKVGLVVRDSDRIMNVVKKIKERIRFNEDEQRLECGGQILRYGDEYVKSIKYYGITEGSVITVVARLGGGMSIFAKIMDGETIAFEVTDNARIIDIKKKIHEKIGLIPEEQILMHNGRIIDNDKTVDEYQIVEKSVINVWPRLGGGGMQIFAKTMDGKIITFEVSENDTIIDIKKMIHEKIGLAPDEQKLVYRGRILDNDDTTVEEYQIAESSIINVIYRLRGGDKILVKTMDGRTFAFEVTNNNTVFDIKKMIHEKIKLSPDKQILMHNGIYLLDDKTVKDYQLSGRSVIKIVGKSLRIINVRTMEGQICVIALIDNCTIPDVKKMIREELKLSPDEQILRYKRVILLDDKTIEYYNIIDNGSIDVVIDYKPIHILITSKLEGTLPLIVKNNDTIKDIKKMIQGKIGQPSDKQILKLDRKMISDDSLTVYQCKVTDNSTIEVSSRIIITILSNNMETVPLEISSSDTIIDVKKKIQEKIGLSYDDQILEFANRILSNDNKTVDYYNIGGDSDVTMRGWQTRATRGICLVISNETFDTNKPRRGTTIDEANIKKTFEEMNYEVKIYPNVRNSDMARVISETKTAVKDSHQMLIVFILSHGKEGGVITVDEVIIPFRNIWIPFSNEYFAKLSGKPKLFFFVCCQGSKENIAVSGSKVDRDGPSATAALCPAMADFFIGYATCESYVALRTPTKGTHYVDCLCRVVRDYPRWSIADIHQEVQSVLSRQVCEGTHIQMPHFDSRLRTHAYLCDYI